MEYGYRETREVGVYDSRDASCDSRKTHHSLLGKIADAVDDCNEKAVEFAQDQVEKREDEECRSGHAGKHKSIITKAVEAAEGFVAKGGHEHTEGCRRYGSGCICRSRTDNSRPYSSPVVANYGYSTEEVSYESDRGRLDSASRANVNVNVGVDVGTSNIRMENTEVGMQSSSAYQSTRVYDGTDEYQNYAGASRYDGNSRYSSATQGDDSPYSRRIGEDYGYRSRTIEEVCENDSSRADSSTHANVDVEVENYGGVNKVRVASTKVSSCSMGSRSAYRSRDSDSDGSDDGREEYSRNDSEYGYRSNGAYGYGHSRRITEDDCHESHSRRDDSWTRATTNVEVENYDGFSKLSLENTEVSTCNDGATCRESRVWEDSEERSEEYPGYDGGSHYASGYQGPAVNDYSYPSRNTDGFEGCTNDATRTTVKVKVEVEVEHDGQARGVYGPSEYEDRNAYSRRTYESDSNLRNYSSH